MGSRCISALIGHIFIGLGSEFSQLFLQLPVKFGLLISGLL